MVLHRSKDLELVGMMNDRWVEVGLVGDEDEDEDWIDLDDLPMMMMMMMVRMVDDGDRFWCSGSLSYELGPNRLSLIFYGLIRIRSMIVLDRSSSSSSSSSSSPPPHGPRLPPYCLVGIHTTISTSLFCSALPLPL